ncbi:MAG: hypothetical protein AAF408_05625 [Pseudomonadota bacterium]
MTVEAFTEAEGKLISGTGPYNVGHAYKSGALVVEADDGAGTVTLLVLDTDYTLSPAAGDDGDVTLTAGAATTYDGQTLNVRRRTPVEQGFAGQTAREQGMEDNIDRLAMALQEIEKQSYRALRADTGEVEPLSLEADKAVIVSPTGDGFLMGPTIDEISTAQQYALDAQAARDDINARMFDTRAAFITWAAANSPGVGMTAFVTVGGDAGTVTFRYDGAGSDFTESDLDGWHAAAPVYLEHYGITTTANKAVEGTDYTVQVQAAMEATEGELIFTGWVKISDKIVCPNRCSPNCPEGRTYGGFSIFSDFNMSATCVFQPGTGEAGATIGKLGMWFYQPVAPASRAELIQYPPAVNIGAPEGEAALFDVAATNIIAGREYEIKTVGTTDFTLIGSPNNDVGTVFEATGPGTGTGVADTVPGSVPAPARGSMEQMRIEQAWDGVIGVGNCGGYKIGLLEMSAFNRNPDFWGARDFIQIETIHIWVFGFPANPILTALFYDGQTIGFRARQCDGLTVDKLQVFRAKVVIGRSGITSILPIKINDLSLDGDKAVLRLDGECSKISMCYSTKSASAENAAYQDILASGGLHEINSAKVTSNSDGAVLTIGDADLHIDDYEIRSVAPDRRAGLAQGNSRLSFGIVRPRSDQARTGHMFVQQDSASMHIGGIAPSDIGQPAVPYVEFETDHALNYANCPNYLIEFPAGAVLGTYIGRAEGGGINFPLVAKINDRSILAYNSTGDHGVKLGDDGNAYGAEYNAWADSFDGTPLWHEPGFAFSDQRLKLKQATEIRGGALTRMGPQPLHSIEAHKMAAGLHLTMQGAGIVMTDEAALVNLDTARSDLYDNLNPMAYVDLPVVGSGHGPVGVSISDLALIQYGDWYNGTTPQAAASLNLAANFDCGIATFGSRCLIDRVNVVGLLSKGGHLHVARAGDNYSDPDACTVRDSTIMSGVRVLGLDTGTPDGGNTCARYLACNLFGATYPLRTDSDPNVPAFFADGLTIGRGIRGTLVSQCYLNTLANRAIVLGQCDTIAFQACSGEFSTAAAAGLETQGEIIGADLTRSVYIDIVAEVGHLGLRNFIDTISGPFEIRGGARWGYRHAAGLGGGSLGTGTGTARIDDGRHEDGWIESNGMRSQSHDTGLMADDTSLSLTPPNRSGGFVDITGYTSGGQPQQGVSATLWIDVNPSAFVCANVGTSIGVAIRTATTDLNESTADDNFVTCTVLDNEFRIINRHGASRRFRVSFRDFAD